MKEVARDPDIFKLRLMKHRLEEHDIHAIIMDEHVGGLYHGIGNIMPRLMVLDEDAERALEILALPIP